jgi:CBS domain-containing protein
LERLNAAKQSGALLSREDATSLGEIFPFFFQLRLQEQLKALAARKAVDHTISLADLSPMVRRHLKEAFVVIKQIQDALRAAWQLNRLG